MSSSSVKGHFIQLLPFHENGIQRASYPHFFTVFFVCSPSEKMSAAGVSIGALPEELSASSGATLHKGVCKGKEKIAG